MSYIRQQTLFNLQEHRVAYRLVFDVIWAPFAFSNRLGHQNLCSLRNVTTRLLLFSTFKNYRYICIENQEFLNTLSLKDL